MTKDEETSLKKFMEIGKLIQDYADLEVAKEREACAKVCDGFYKGWINIHGRYKFMGEGAEVCADAIRARGEQA